MKALNSIAIVLACACGFTACIGEGKTPDGDTGGAGGAAGSGGTGGDQCVTWTPSSAYPCQVFPQCGCSSAQSNCVFTKSSTANSISTECVEAGTVQAYRACTNHSGDCDEGTTCLDGVCKPFCLVNGDCVSGTCSPVYWTGSATIPGFSVCASGCDPLSPQAKCGPLNCSLAKGGALDCLAFGSGTGPGDCSTSNPSTCKVGYFCYNGNDCARWCRAPPYSDCEPQLKCWSLSPSVKANGTEYGVCLP